jgi:hypothetical protein
MPLHHQQKHNQYCGNHGSCNSQARLAASLAEPEDCDTKTVYAIAVSQCTAFGASMMPNSQSMPDHHAHEQEIATYAASLNTCRIAYGELLVCNAIEDQPLNQCHRVTVTDSNQKPRPQLNACSRFVAADQHTQYTL